MILSKYKVCNSKKSRFIKNMKQVDYEVASGVKTHFDQIPILVDFVLGVLTHKY